MHRAYKYLLKPTIEQEKILVQWAGCARWVWNWALERNIKQYEQDETFVFRYNLGNELVVIKKEHDWLREPPAHVLLNQLLNFDTALRRSFKKANKRAGFPKFKSKHTSEPAFKIDQVTGHIKPKSQAIKIPKLGWVSWFKHRPLEGRLKSITIKQEGNKWYVSCLCEVPDANPVMDISEDETVGVDLGIKEFAVTSDGEVIASKNFFRNDQKKLAKEQRSLSRKTKGSSNRNKQRLKVATVHCKIKNKRRDFINQQAAAIAKLNLVVFVEDLNVAGMKRNRHLSKSISDQGWGMFVTRLEQKMEEKGGHLVKIDRFAPSSKTCSCCGSIKQDLTLADRTYSCDTCGLEIDRDMNAAINIKSFGIDQLKNRAGTARIYASGEPANGEVAYDTSSYDSLKEESFGSLDPKPLELAQR
jgi:putative transposase